jgi:hypothetical protein
MMSKEECCVRGGRQMIFVCSLAALESVRKAVAVPKTSLRTGR